MKQCSKCKEFKDESLFYDNGGKYGGKRSDCKSCVCSRQRVVYDQKPDCFKSGQYKKNKCPKCGNLKSHYAIACYECSPRRIDPENPRWRKNRHGYMIADLARGREIRQHRFVMEKAIGRPLLPHESVHHKNGIRDDNRLENLELWSNSHPSGQRVEDKVKWALEILTLYGKMAEDNVFET